jgi:hypothetical protein
MPAVTSCTGTVSAAKTRAGTAAATAAACSNLRDRFSSATCTRTDSSGAWASICWRKGSRSAMTRLNRRGRAVGRVELLQDAVVAAVAGHGLPPEEVPEFGDLVGEPAELR